MTTAIKEIANQIALIKTSSKCPEKRIIEHKVIGLGWMDNNNMIHEIRTYFDALDLDIKSIEFIESRETRHVHVLAQTNDPA